MMTGSGPTAQLEAAQRAGAERRRVAFLAFLFAPLEGLDVPINLTMQCLQNREGLGQPLERLQVSRRRLHHGIEKVKHSVDRANLLSVNRSEASCQRIPLAERAIFEFF